MYENMYDVYKQKVVTEPNKKVKNTRLWIKIAICLECAFSFVIDHDQTCSESSDISHAQCVVVCMCEWVWQLDSS